MADNDLDALIKEFTYRVQPTPGHEELMQEIKLYYQENEKFMKKWNKEAGKRARKHLLKIFHLSRQRRAEISDVIYRGDEDAS